MNYNCSNSLGLRNLQEQVKKALCYQKLFWPFTVWINCSCDLKFFENSRTSESNFFLIWILIQNFCKFSAFSLEFQKFFSITRTIFSHSRSEQFWYQNTIVHNFLLRAIVKIKSYDKFAFHSKPITQQKNVLRWS